MLLADIKMSLFSRHCGIFQFKPEENIKSAKQTGKRDLQTTYTFVFNAKGIFQKLLKAKYPITFSVNLRTKLQLSMTNCYMLIISYLPCRYDVFVEPFFC